MTANFAVNHTETREKRAESFQKGNKNTSIKGRVVKGLFRRRTKYGEERAEMGGVYTVTTKSPTTPSRLNFAPLWVEDKQKEGGGT